MSNTTIRTIRLPSGEEMPVLGQGTWGMAEDAHRREAEIAALRLGLDLGMTLIDTAEMYANGAAEELVAEAIAGRREEVFLVSKVLPKNATRRGTISACERSLRRLGTDRLDLYLLHWRGRPALEETLDAFSLLASAGKIRHWGVAISTSRIWRNLWAYPVARLLQPIRYSITSRGAASNTICCPGVANTTFQLWPTRQ